MTHKILYKVRYDIIKYNGRRFHELGGINITFPEYRNFVSETQFRGKYSAEMGPARKKREETARRIRLFRKFCAPSLAIGFVRKRGKAGCTVLKREKQGVARV